MTLTLDNRSRNKESSLTQALRQISCRAFKLYNFGSKTFA
jgi:hypothetical protein